MRPLAVVVLALTAFALFGVALVERGHAPLAPPLSPAPSTAAITDPLAVLISAVASTTTPRAAPALVMRSSAPVSVTIPAIRVRTPVRALGQTADGAIAVPQPGPHYDDAGWYRYSPTPGERGPAVLVGHVDSARGGPSVFYRLGELHQGDAISIRRADGSVAVFAVDDVRRFAKAAFPTALVYGNTSDAALRLITCGGPFDRTTGHYLDNVIVTARLTRTV